MSNKQIDLLPNYLRVGVVLLSVLWLTGCLQPGKENLKHYVEEVKAREAAPIEPIPEVKTHENFSYAAAELRDPFKATVVEVQPIESARNGGETNGVGPNPERLKEALEGYSLEDLRLVGTLEKGRRSGLIRAPDGVVHLVDVGNHIGENNGKILAITDTELKIREIVEGKKFAWVERENTLSLE